jgi:hypothetical protein
VITPPQGARALVVVLTISAFGFLPAAASAATTQNVDGGTGVGEVPLYPEVAGAKATLNPDGTATPPVEAPESVKTMIRAGNVIAKKPYRYGGGHGNFRDTGYDCSGSVSYALYKAHLLKEALDSTGFMSWGDNGPGTWVSIYANSGHAYMTVAGLRFDTSGKSAKGSRWQSAMRSGSGYRVRHPVGL